MQYENTKTYYCCIQFYKSDCSSAIKFMMSMMYMTKKHRFIWFWKIPKFRMMLTSFIIIANIISLAIVIFKINITLRLMFNFNEDRCALLKSVSFERSSKLIWIGFLFIPIVFVNFCLIQAAVNALMHWTVMTTHFELLYSVVKHQILKNKISSLSIRKILY